METIGNIVLKITSNYSLMNRHTIHHIIEYIVFTSLKNTG